MALNLGQGTKGITVTKIIWGSFPNVSISQRLEYTLWGIYQNAGEGREGESRKMGICEFRKFQK